jgi:hypothetical protein
VRCTNGRVCTEGNRFQGAKAVVGEGGDWMFEQCRRPLDGSGGGCTSNWPLSQQPAAVASECSTGSIRNSCGRGDGGSTGGNEYCQQQ